MESAESPAQRTLRAQIEAPDFVRGVEEGRWQLLQFAFPHVYVRVRAVDPETGTAAQADFHASCDGFPSPGPFVELWDYDRGQRPRPPAGGSASPGYVDALKDWNESSNQHGGIYRAWQRYAATHNSWAQMRPDQAWHVQRRFTFIMERLYDLVAEQAGWLGARSTQAVV